MRSFVPAVLALIVLTSCQLRTDAPSEAPTGVAVKEGDGLVVVSWDTLPDLTYWIFFAQGTSVGVGQPGTIAIRRAIPPRVLAGLSNEGNYAFTLNATHDDSAAGPSSVPIIKSPRLAGKIDTWTVGPAIGAPPKNLKSAAFSNSRFVVVGDAATVFWGNFDYTSDFRDPLNPPGVTSWQLPSVPAGTSFPVGPAVNLSSVIFNGTFIALGTDNAPGATSSPVISSSDGLTWTSNTPVPALGMNAIGFGQSLTLSATLVAVGDQGRIFTTADLNGSWNLATSVPTNAALNSVAFFNGAFYVTGTGGTLLTSSDGMTWNQLNLNPTTASTLRGLTFTPLGSGANYVAVGDGGVIATNNINGVDNGDAWTAITLPGAPDLRSVTVGGASGTRFLAVGLNGAVAFGSEPSGLGSWSVTSAGLGNTANLTKVLIAPGMYLAVGDNGANAVSR